jgi:hypothetical protein
VAAFLAYALWFAVGDLVVQILLLEHFGDVLFPVPCFGAVVGWLCFLMQHTYMNMSGLRIICSRLQV